MESKVTVSTALSIRRMGDLVWGRPFPSISLFFNKPFSNLKWLVLNVTRRLNKSIEASLGDIPQIALTSWTSLACTEMVILDSVANRFTPLLSMHDLIEAFVSIKAQNEWYCKCIIPQGQQKHNHERKLYFPYRMLFHMKIIPILPGQVLMYLWTDVVKKKHSL